MRDLVMRNCILAVLLLSVGSVHPEPQHHQLQLPEDAGSLSGPLHVEFAWRSRTNDGEPEYTWDWRWGVSGNVSEGLYLKRSPQIEWDVLHGGRKVGRLLDRFQGALPVYAGTWGAGRFRRASQSAAKFIPYDVWTKTPVRPEHILVRLNVSGVAHVSLPAKFESGLSDLGAELMISQTRDEFSGRGGGKATSVEVIRAASHEQLVAELRRLVADGHKLWRHEPADPWRRVRREALLGRLQLTNPRILDVEFGREKLKIFRDGELAAVLQSRKDTQPGNSILNFDRVWEKEADRKRRGFELADFKRENRVEALILAGRKQLCAKDYQSALRSLRAAQSYGGRLPADFRYLLGAAQIKTGDYHAGAKNLADYAASAPSTDLNYDNCFDLLADLRDSGRIAALPSDYRRAVEAVLRKAPSHFASLDSIGLFYDRSPAEIATEEEKKSMVEIDGHKFFSEKLGVVLDVSGSMSFYLPDLRRKIANDFPDPVAVDVVGCRLDGNSDVMQAFERLIIRNKVDNIYWFSDLQDGVTREALTKLRTLLRDNSVVLHVTSVGRSESDLNRLVAEFGGKVVVR